jgi:hypothetical protein
VRSAAGALRPPQREGSRPSLRRRTPAPACAGQWDVGGRARGRARRQTTAKLHGVSQAEGIDELRETVGIVGQAEHLGGSVDWPQPGASHATTVYSSERASSCGRHSRLSLRQPCNRTSSGPSPARSYAMRSPVTAICSTPPSLSATRHLEPTPDLHVEKRQHVAPNDSRLLVRTQALYGLSNTSPQRH